MQRLFLSLLFLGCYLPLAMAADILNPPVLSLETVNKQVTARWTAVDGATGYRFFFAPYPNATPINSFELTDTQITVELPETSAYYIAVAAFAGVQQSEFSNIEFFVVDKAYSAAKQATFQNILNDFAQQVTTAPAVLISIVNDDGSAWRGVRGVADVKTARAVQKTDNFEIGSITKTYIATLILQLMEDGKLNLEDKIVNYLPELTKLVVVNGQDYTNQVTIRQLVQHLSGIPDYVTDEVFAEYVSQKDSVQFTPELIFSLARRYSANSFIPGEKYAYSNTNYIILGMLIEKLTGKKVETVLRERIYQPLSLYHSSLKSYDSALGYTMHNYYGNEEMTQIHGSVAWTAGGIISNSYDLQRFFKAAVTGKLFQQSSTLNLVLNDSRKTDFSLGGFKVMFNNVYYMIGHTTGQFSAAAYLPNQKTTLIATVNQGDPSLEPILESYVQQLIFALLF